MPLKTSPKRGEKNIKEGYAFTNVNPPKK